MNFTEGKDLEYERLMKQKPGFHKKRDKTSRERDCPHCRQWEQSHCLYWDEARQQCPRDKCIVFSK